MTWSDNMLMPKNEKEYYGAETFMNYVYDPEIAAQIAAVVNYFCPVKGAKEVLEKTDPELAGNTLIFPDDATLEQLHAYPSLDQARGARDHRGDAEGHRGVSTAGATTAPGTGGKPTAQPPRAPAGAVRRAGPDLADRLLRDPGRQPAVGLAADRQPRRRLHADLELAGLSRRARRVPRAADALVRVRGDGDGPVLRHRLPAGVLHRRQGGPLPEPLPAADHPAVLHEPDHAHRRLADAPDRRRLGRQHAADARAAWPTTAACSRRGRR